MKMLTAALGAAVVLAASAQSPAPAGGGAMAGSAMKKPVQIKMTAQNGSGENGTATLMDGVKGLIVKVRIANAPENVAQPMHIHKGSCDKLDPKPAYPLHSLQNGMSETTIEGVTLASLEKGKFAINAHKSPSDIPTYVSCGNIASK